MANFVANENLFYYFYWMKERMDIFWNKLEGKEVLTENPIFKEYKFTNVYRCLDRVSQYLIRNVIYNEKGINNDYDTEDIFWRIILFKHFNKIETWEMLEKEFGEITLDINFDDIIEFLNDRQRSGSIIYSNAYMLTAPIVRLEDFVKKFGISKNATKQEIYLKVFRGALFDNKFVYTILRSQSLKELFNNLESVVTMGGFLAMQYSLDLNYSTLFNFDENEFNRPGHGAVRGMKRCFTFEKENPEIYLEVLRWIQDNFEELESISLGNNKIKFLPGRNPSLADLQNCFCETDKYMRGLGIKADGVKGSRIKQKFTPNSNKIEYFFPPKWGIKI